MHTCMIYDTFILPPLFSSTMCTGSVRLPFVGLVVWRERFAHVVCETGGNNLRWDPANRKCRN